MLAKVESYDKGMNMIADTGMKTIVMRSAVPGHEMTGMVFWSKAKGETYLAIHNMPMPEKGKQYQLWVIQDGKPVSMGMVDNDLVANAGKMIKVPMLVKNGQAFAISLEKEGGNPTPTEVMVVGAI
jgi:anti-sigma-K factor RskA